MNFHIFKIRCITNLHVGSGDINYNVVDKEVEKDITGLPMIHASGIKGALLKHFKDQKMDENLINYIFGAKGNGGGSNPGAYRFMDARLLARPMRADKGSSPCVNVTSESMLQDFLNDIADFGGKMPEEMDELLKFPGVGRKIANLLRGDLFGLPAIVADTHCIRLGGRFGMYPQSEKNPTRVEAILTKLVEPAEQSDLCHRLVQFGRDVCTARAPQCEKCPLRELCEMGRKGK